MVVTACSQVCQGGPRGGAACWGGLSPAKKVAGGLSWENKKCTAPTRPVIRHFTQKPIRDRLTSSQLKYPAAVLAASDRSAIGRDSERRREGKEDGSQRADISS